MNSPNPSVGKSSIRQAVEDALTVAMLSLTGGLIAAGPSWPPSVNVVYGAGLAALLAAIVAYMRARAIQGGT